MELQDFEYNLIVTTKFVRKTVIEEKLKTKYERKMVILIPDVTTECMKFFRAWLPDSTEEYHEIAAEIHSPVASPCRLSIHRAPHPYSEDKHFLFVMSKGVEELFLRLPEGRRFQLTVLPQGEESATDFAKDSDEGNYQVAES